MANLYDDSVTIPRTSLIPSLSIRPSSVKSKVFAVNIGGHHTDFAVFVYR